VVYQKDAIVLTKIPETYRGLRRMLLRWARSNVRECLVMARYLYTPFRRGDSGTAWMRLGGSVELGMLILEETLKVGLFLNMLFHPVITLSGLAVGCATTAILPAMVYQFRRPGLFGCIWGLAYTYFWITCLFWISGWGLMTAGCSGWLTRGTGRTPAALPALAVQKHSEVV